MAYGQTNRILKGSVLMDFIAEIVLGYADLKITEKINENELKDYQILRYRDDYRIFSNNPQTVHHTTKLLTETLIELGMRLNAHKTILSKNIIKDSIKADKLYWIYSENRVYLENRLKNIQNCLLIIHKLSEEYPNSGSLVKVLFRFLSALKQIPKINNQNIKVLTSIVVDIMYKNPKTYPVSTAIISNLLSLLE